MARKAKRANKSPASASADLVGKRLRFDRETWNAIQVMSRDQMKSLEELTEEAFADLLKKHGRSADFRQQLKLSVRAAKNAKKK